MAGFRDRIYAQMPVPVQHLLVSAYGAYWNRLRFGGRFTVECQAFREREHFTKAQWDAYVTRQLRTLLTSAYDLAPHYRKSWQGVTRAQLEKYTITDLPNLPPLEKSTTRDDPFSLLMGGKPQPAHRVFHTSGSSGTPVATYWLPEELQRSLALRETRSCGFAGVSFRLPRATFSGRIVEPDPESNGPYYRYNLVERQVYFSAFHLRPDAVPLYLNALERHNIQWMTGYSNSVYQLAQLAESQNLHVPMLKAVITTSEKITEAMRQTVERVFRTRVYEEYGTVEDLFYVCECEYSRKHINPDAGIIEVVDEHLRPVQPGEMGEVLATGFIRPSQPTIRYRIGDLAVLDDEPCPCGRQMPVLREVVGRLEDTIYGLDGRRMVRFHGIFVNQPHVREGQIIQEKRDLIRVRIVPKTEFDPSDRQDIIHRIQQRLTANMRVEVELVDTIERTKAGKFRAVICNLSPGERERALHR